MFSIRFLSRATTVLLPLAVLLSCSQGRDAATVLDAGVEQLEQGDLTTARASFEQVAGEFPGNAMAHFYLGEVHARQSHTSDAVLSYRKAAELDGQHVLSRYRLGVIYARTNRPAFVREQATSLRAIEGGEVYAKVVEAMALLLEGRRDSAKQLLIEVVTAAPGNPDASRLLARLHLEDGEEPLALEVLEALNTAVDGTDTNVLNQLLLMYNNRKDSVNAERVILQLVENNPDDLGVLRTMIKFYSSIDEISRAVEILRESISEDPTNLAKYRLLVDLYSTRFGLARAITETRAYIGMHPKMTGLRLILAGLYERAGQIGPAVQVYRGVVDMAAGAADGLDARAELARVALEQGSTAEALAMFDENLTQDAAHPRTLLYRAQHRIGAHRKDEAIEDLRTVMRVQPSNTRAGLLLVSLLMERGMDAEAMQYVNTVIEHTPADVEATLLQAQLLQGQGRHRQALAMFARILANDAASAEAIRGVVRSRIAMGTPGVAVSFLQKVIEKYPRHASAHEILGEVYLGRNDYASAVAAFNEQIEVGTDSRTVHMQLAQARAGAGDSKAMLAALEAGMELHPDDPAIRARLAEAYASREMPDQAAAVLRDGLERRPDAAALGILLAGLYQQQDRVEDAIAVYDRLYANGSRAPLLINNLAATLVDHRDDADSLRRAGELVEWIKDSEAPLLQDTVGWVYHRLGRNEEAASRLAGVVETVPDNATFCFHLGKVYHELGRIEEARQMYSCAVTAGEGADVGRSARELLERLETSTAVGSTAAALALY